MIIPYVDTLHTSLDEMLTSDLLREHQAWLKLYSHSTYTSWVENHVGEPFYSRALRYQDLCKEIDKRLTPLDVFNRISKNS